MIASCLALFGGCSRSIPVAQRVAVRITTIARDMLKVGDRLHGSRQSMRELAHRVVRNEPATKKSLAQTIEASHHDQ